MRRKIKIELVGKANKKLLEELLAEKYEISAHDFDLLILDDTTLSINRGFVKELRSKSYIPVLLVTRDRIKEDLWELVDDIIKIPVEKTELIKRVEVLLRIREQTIELKKHAEMLELELASLFESIGNPVMIISPNFEIIYVNKKLREILELIGIKNPRGMKCYTLAHGTDEPIEICPVVATFNSGELETREMEIPIFGGSFVVTTTPIFEDGKLEKIIHIMVDVTPLRDAEKELRDLFSEISRLNDLLRVIYRLNRQIVKRSDFRDVIADVVKELRTLGECFFTFDKDYYCVREATERNEIVRTHSEDCKFYPEHKDKQIIAFPLELDSERGVLVLIAERLRESEFELIKTLLEDVKFVREKLKLENEKDKLLDQLHKNIDEFAYFVDRIRNPLTVIFAFTELFGDENIKKRIQEQVLRIDEIISRLDKLWADSEKLKEALEK